KLEQGITEKCYEVPYEVELTDGFRVDGNGEIRKAGGGTLVPLGDIFEYAEIKEHAEWLEDWKVLVEKFPTWQRLAEIAGCEWEQGIYELIEKAKEHLR